MSTISLRLPESLHRRVRELARSEETSINQFVTTAIAEKMAALMTLDYLAARARRGSRSKFDRVLAKIKDRKPVDGDEVLP
jgi:predicted transcriptional regulator